MTRSQRLLQMTDTHLLADPQAHLSEVDVERRFQATLEAMRPWAERSDALVHTGDLVHDGSHTGYRRLQAALATLDLPVRVIPGNHDDREVMAGVFKQGRVRAEHTLDMADWLLITLDSLWPGEVSGRLAQTELDALDQALALADAAHVLVALHHPPVAVGTPWLDAIGLQQAQTFWARLEAEPRLRGVLFGHIHHVYDGYREQVRLLATPATAAQFLAASPTFALDPAAPAFRCLDCFADGRIETQVVHVPMD
ncbi:MAG: metallophosphoesterase [Spiribacter sp.]|jgi:Icc protein|nr:metallophosphoesterase [Spiribacter sp.]